MRTTGPALLVQLPIPPPGPGPLKGNVPLAAAYMKLMARRMGVEGSFAVEVLPAPEANALGDQALVACILERKPWLVGFTCYLWNIERTLWVAREIKSRAPETVILLGGPEIAPGNDWVFAAGAFDHAAVGEGERTFAEFLMRRAAGEGADGIPGLIARGRPDALVPRPPMRDLDAISSPYLEGILDAGDDEQLLLETVRGCVFRCKFCYYPKAYDGLYFASREKVLAGLAHARERGAREVYILDPTLNQRRDFREFLETLRDGNAGRSLELHAELRGEGITESHARLMKEANFKEVEIGLQSTGGDAQVLMDRKNNLRFFEHGVRALQAAGIRVKVDLIIGLPGDTVESIRAGMEYLAANRLYDDIQVFQLSVLPGTSFRAEAGALGLEFQPRPPYYVLRTPALALEDMLGLLAEAEDVFDVEFDALPPPAMEPAPSGAWIDRAGPPRTAVLDLDAGVPELPERCAQAFTAVLRSRDIHSRLPAAEKAVAALVRRNPFTTLQVTLDAGGGFPLDVLKRLRAAAARPESLYLDRFHEFTPGRPAAATRLAVLLDEGLRARVDPDWIEDALCHAEVVWRGGGAGDGPPGIAEIARPGEWRWTPVRPRLPAGSPAGPPG